MTVKDKKKFSIFGVIIGNIIEWYDFSLYGYFSTVFAIQYFPSDEYFLSILSVYGLLAASYFMRPVGALIFGHIGDTAGRKRSLSYSVILMGVCSFLVAILPTYADWGILAGIALLIIRLVQGIAVGGEYSGATLYLIESAECEKRTFFGSLALSSSYSGFLLGSSVSLLLTYLFSSEQITEWAWRLGFALGGLIAIVGFYTRQQIHDIPILPVSKKQSVPISPIKDLFLNHQEKFTIALGIAILPAGFSYMIFVYFLNFIEVQVGIPTKEIFYINTLAILFVISIVPLIGYAGDLVGRKVLMIGSATLILILCIPLFNLLRTNTLVALLGFILLNALFEACLSAEIAELFPASCRYTAFSLILNLTNGIAGGAAPIIAATLLYTTGSMVSPMFYIIILSLIALLSQLRSIKFYTFKNQ